MSTTAVLPTAEKARHLVAALADRQGGGAERTAHREPATGRALPEFVLDDAEVMTAAASDARAALADWRRSRPVARRDALRSLASSLEANAADLAGVAALELGQSWRVQHAAVQAAAEQLHYFGGWADKLDGRVVPLGEGVLDYVVHEPVGVIAALVPWNGPIIATALKVGPALAAGCTVVVKASEVTPATARLLGRVLDAAGLPSGVLRLVVGGPEAGAALVEADDIDKISFTGGVPTSRHVMAAAARRGRPVVMELGGKSACLAFDDCDAGAVAKLVVDLGICQNSGQGCFLPTRLLVARARAAEVIDAVATRVASRVAADPFDGGRPTDGFGPVISAAARSRILGVIDKGRHTGTLIAGGEALDRDGWWVEPTVFADVDPASDLAQEEIFGPVLAITAFDDEEEAIALANGTRYGLGAYIHTRDLSRAHRVASRVEAGWVCVNGMAFLPPAAPFGGVKDSGFGREGGREAVEEMTTTKNVHVVLS